MAALCAIFGNAWWAFYPSDSCRGECGTMATLPPVVAMGLAYGLMAGTTWNVIIYIVNGKRVGTAIGMTNCILNLGLMLTPIIMGELKDHSDYLEFGYYWVTRFSLAMSVVSLFVGFKVWWHDFTGTKLLTMNVKERNEFNKSN